MFESFRLELILTIEIDYIGLVDFIAQIYYSTQFHVNQSKHKSLYPKLILTKNEF